MKDILIEKYGEKQGNLYFEKFTEDEIYDAGILEKELPTDDKWKEKFLELEAKVKEKDTLLKEKEEYISTLKNESIDKRKKLEESNLTKEQTIEKLALYEKENEEFKVKLEKLTDYEKDKEKLNYFETSNQKRKEYLLSKVTDEKKRDVLNQKFEYAEEIEAFIDDIPDETNGINNTKPTIDKSSESFMNLAKQLF